jgi:hypothetical protein
MELMLTLYEKYGFKADDVRQNSDSIYIINQIISGEICRFVGDGAAMNRWWDINGRLRNNQLRSSESRPYQLLHIAVCDRPPVHAARAW